MESRHPDRDVQRSLLVAYRLGPEPAPRLVSAPISRAWMDHTDQRFAQRCLPLLIANQAGWFILNSHTIVVRWSGGNEPAALQIEYVTGGPPYLASSHFGYGILTWNIPYLFRTAPGYNLLVRGPSNWPKDGVTALEGIVEADWSVATFTMNWKVTTIDHPIVFEVDEPICMVVPQTRGDLETLEPVVRDVADDAELHQAYQSWSESRSQFLADLVVPGSEAARQRWQKHYFQGTTPDGSVAPSHQTRLQLRDFTTPDDTDPV
jgi:hypothetical protein